MRVAIGLAAFLLIGAASRQPWSVRPLDEPAITSDQWESHPAIDPLTGDVWFVRSDPKFSGWHLMIARCTAAGLAPAEPAPIAAPGLEADPFFADRGRTLYFISTGATGSRRSADLDIWRVRRMHGGWGAPERLPEPVNSASAEWFPRPAPEGWLYFGSLRPGGMGKDDIWRARQQGKGWIVENAGPAFNTAGEEYEFQPSPDGTWGILSADSGLYLMTHGPHGWTGRTPLPANVNATQSEIGPMISPDGHSFLFSRDAKDGRSGELWVAADGKGRPWPSHCGKNR
jgi:hypothetical protein